MNRKILSHQTRLDNLFKKIETISEISDQAEWSKYLCVLVSGYLEEALRILLEEYVSQTASPNVKNFIAQEIERITNCKTTKIETILERFSLDWKHEFSTKITDKIKNSINSIVDNRNSLVHGKNVGITYTQISGHYENVNRAVRILEGIIK